MRPASLVAWRWLSLKYAGTVTTAFSTGSPKCASARSLSDLSTIAETSGGVTAAIAHLDLHDALGRHHRERQVGQLLLDVVVAPPISRFTE